MATWQATLLVLLQYRQTYPELFGKRDDWSDDEKPKCKDLEARLQMAKTVVKAARDSRKDLETTATVATATAVKAVPGAGPTTPVAVGVKRRFIGMNGAGAAQTSQTKKKRKKSSANGSEKKKKQQTRRKGKGKKGR